MEYVSFCYPFINNPKKLEGLYSEKIMQNRIEYILTLVFGKRYYIDFLLAKYATKFFPNNPIFHFMKDIVKKTNINSEDFESLKEMLRFQYTNCPEMKEYKKEFVDFCKKYPSLDHFMRALLIKNIIQ